jgi:hypothetical protein
VKLARAVARTNSAARPEVEEVDDLGAGRSLAELREDTLEAVPVGVRVVIGHRVRGEHDVVAVVVGGACGRLDAGAGGDAGQDNLSDAEVPQQGVEAGVVEGTAAPLRDQVVARLQLKLVDDVRPARGKRAGAAVAAGVGPAGSAARDVDQHEREAMLAEGLRQGCRRGHDVRNCAGDDSLLHSSASTTGSPPPP